VPLIAVLDSGASATLIEEELFEALNGTYVSREVKKLSSVMQNPVPTVGEGVIDIDIGQGIETQQCTIISKEVTLPTPIILGLDFIFRKAVVVRPVYVSDGSKRLLLTFGGIVLDTETAPDGCIGDFPSEPQD